MDDLSQTEMWEEMLLMDENSLLQFSKTNETARKIFEDEHYWEERSSFMRLGEKHGLTSWAEHVVWSGRIFAFSILIFEGNPTDHFSEMCLDKIFEVDPRGYIAIQELALAEREQMRAEVSNGSRNG